MITFRGATLVPAEYAFVARSRRAKRRGCGALNPNMRFRTMTLIGRMSCLSRARSRTLVPCIPVERDLMDLL